MPNVPFRDHATKHVWQILSASALGFPRVPVLESLLLDDQPGASDVVVDVVPEEVVAVLVASATGSKGVAPLVAANLEHAVLVAGFVTRTGAFLGVEAALVLHHANVAADEGSGYSGPNQRLGRVALAEDTTGAHVDEEE